METVKEGQTPAIPVATAESSAPIISKEDPEMPLRKNNNRNQHFLANRH
jgi:hypothetical protein